MMTVELAIKRNGGSHVNMPPTPANPKGLAYHFTVDPKIDPVAHVAAVEDTVHLKRFLAIDEYTIFEGGAPLTDVGGRGVGVAVGATDPASATAAAATNVRSAAAVAPASATTTATAAETDKAATAQTAETDRKPTAAAQAVFDPTIYADFDEAQLTALETDVLKQLFEAEVKKTPHHRAGNDRLANQIVAVRAEAAKA